MRLHTTDTIEQGSVRSSRSNKQAATAPENEARAKHRSNQGGRPRKKPPPPSSGRSGQPGLSLRLARPTRLPSVSKMAKTVRRKVSPKIKGMPSRVGMNCNAQLPGANGINRSTGRRGNEELPIQTSNDLATSATSQGQTKTRAGPCGSQRANASAGSMALTSAWKTAGGAAKYEVPESTSSMPATMPTPPTTIVPSMAHQRPPRTGAHTTGCSANQASLGRPKAR
mmetsp:Transcript_39493/g.105369  ORF Transcript_39493/g.105369 Transcript_39493/m.105369 type:complete len:226 (+) Transcript_39493:222-899(+)